MSTDPSPSHVSLALREAVTTFKLSRSLEADAQAKKKAAQEVVLSEMGKLGVDLVVVAGDEVQRRQGTRLDPQLLDAELPRRGAVRGRVLKRVVDFQRLPPETLDRLVASLSPAERRAAEVLVADDAALALEVLAQRVGADVVQRCRVPTGAAYISIGAAK